MDNVNMKDSYGNNDLNASLLKLKNNKKRIKNEKKYYDEEKDQIIINNYYKEVNFNESEKQEVFKQLNQLMTSTHENQLPYNSNTRNYLYSWVDLHEDGNLKSIYSGERKDPDQVMKADFEAELKRKAAYFKLLTSNTRNNSDILDEMASIESENMYNCEHTVPQSWFDKDNPMRGDLHHLFTCDIKCNSSRSNYPFYDFVDYTPKIEVEKIRDNCGKYEENKFEPENGKGEVARATLYFLIRYPGEISSYNHEDIEMLLKWHNDYKVSIYERHRNMAIYDMQKNRNPLIDFPQYAYKIDFMLGLL